MRSSRTCTNTESVFYARILGRATSISSHIAGVSLSRGVLDLLLEDETGVSSQQVGTEHRPRIARALGLPETDPRVRWVVQAPQAASPNWFTGSTLGPSREEVGSVRDA